MKLAKKKVFKFEADVDETQPIDSTKPAEWEKPNFPKRERFNDTRWKEKSGNKKVFKYEVDNDEAEASGSTTAVAEDKHLATRKGYFRDARRKGWRLIIRNLPFKTKKEDLQVACSRFGPFTEIVLPKCKDSRYPDSCAGFAFVQFKVKKDAEEAVKKLNLSEVNGRKVAVDWALAKDTYETAAFEEKEKGKLASGSSKVKEEPLEDAEEREDEKESEEDDDNDMKDEENSEQEQENSRVKMKSTKPAREFKPDAALLEGRVVFVRNLSYETDDDTLRENLGKFGEVKLAIICRYAGSDHSKGTGFVHFSTREEADKCIAAVENDPGIFVDGRRIYGHRAVPRAEAAAIEKENLEKKPKDKRNMHLLRVGVVRAGTAAARGMSEADAQKREKLALAAKQKLQNLHMFVSPTRLVVHNLPLSLTDKAFRSLCFIAAGNPEAKILECRIWRNKKKTSGEGVARSCGFGFVAFSQHSDALACIRQLNNNPETFTDEKRPIVEFSVENLAALRLKENRLKKSAQKKTAKDVDKADEQSRREVERTKRELASGGQKPLPSHLGPKIRKRDKGKFSKKKSDERRGKKRKTPDVNQFASTKKPKLSKSKQLTKFLAFS